MIIGLDLYTALDPMYKTDHQDPKIAAQILQMLGPSQTIVIIGQTHAAGARSTVPFATDIIDSYWHTADTVTDHIGYLLAVLQYHGHTVKGISLCVWDKFANNNSIRQINQAITEWHALEPTVRNTPLRIYTNKESSISTPTMYEDALVDWVWTNDLQAIGASIKAKIAATHIPKPPRSQPRS